MVDIKYIKQLLDSLDKSTVHQLSIESDGVKIKLSKENKKVQMVASAGAIMSSPVALPQSVPPPTSNGGQTPEADLKAAIPATPIEDNKNYHQVLSPIVGTFYRTPSPDSPAFVEVGSMVAPGDTLCIIEAMKLMNEIESDCYGKIAKIMIESGKPVEYNQVLFLIEPTA